MTKWLFGWSHGNRERKRLKDNQSKQYQRSYIKDELHYLRPEIFSEHTVEISRRPGRNMVEVYTVSNTMHTWNVRVSVYEFMRHCVALEYWPEIREFITLFAWLWTRECITLFAWSWTREFITLFAWLWTREFITQFAWLLTREFITLFAWLWTREFITLFAWLWTREFITLFAWLWTRSIRSCSLYTHVTHIL
mgnify:CR=1 FL=1